MKNKNQKKQKAKEVNASNYNKSIDKSNNNKNNNGSFISKSVKKLLLFPGEEYEFNESLLHYDAFGFNNGNLVTKKCGILVTDEAGKALENQNEEVFTSLGRYYSPKLDDVVIGVIVLKTAEFYKVEINSYTHAILNTMDFEGASKKSKPNLNLGDLVFARVSNVNKFDAPTLSCISLHENKNWASGESFFGQLKGGNLYNFEKIKTSELLDPENYTIKRLRDVSNYDLTVGMNGRLWINSENFQEITKIYKTLIKSFTSSKEEIEKYIHEVYLEQLRN